MLNDHWLLRAASLVVTAVFRDQHGDISQWLLFVFMWSLTHWTQNCLFKPGQAASSFSLLCNETIIRLARSPKPLSSDCCEITTVLRVHSKNTVWFKKQFQLDADQPWTYEHVSSLHLKKISLSFDLLWNKLVLTVFSHQTKRKANCSEVNNQVISRGYSDLFTDSHQSSSDSILTCRAAFNK